MVFSCNLVVAIAHVSAGLWQYVACNPERLSNDQVLDLIFCYPLRQLRHRLLPMWDYVRYEMGAALFISLAPTLSPPDSLSSSSFSSSVSSSIESYPGTDGGGLHHSHSN